MTERQKISRRRNLSRAEAGEGVGNEGERGGEEGEGKWMEEEKEGKGRYEEEEGKGR